MEQDIKFKAPPTGCNAVRAQLFVEESGTGPLTDAILEDNSAWLTLGGHASVIEVVSSLSTEQLGLSRIPGMTFRSVQSPSAPNTPTLFHRVCPPERWTGSFLVVQSEDCQYGDLVSSSPPQTGIEFVRWAESHRILSYVNLGLIVPRSASVLTIRPPFQEIIVSQRGPVAAVSETPSARSAWVGFELFPFEPKEDLSVGILTINLLRWVFDSSWLDAGTGTSHILASSEPVRYLDPGELPTPPQASASLLPIPGLVERENKLLAVNFFDRTLSDLRYPPTESFKTPSKSTSSAVPRSTRDLRGSLIMALVVLLLLDIFLFRWRTRVK
jgi:hypothetical protein